MEDSSLAGDCSLLFLCLIKETLHSQLLQKVVHLVVSLSEETCHCQQLVQTVQKERKVGLVQRCCAPLREELVAAVVVALEGVEAAAEPKGVGHSDDSMVTVVLKCEI